MYRLKFISYWELGMSKLAQKTYVRAVEFEHFVKYVKSQNGDPYAIFEECGLYEKEFTQNSTFIEFELLCKLFEAAALQLDAPDLGISLAMNVPKDMPQIGPVTSLKYFSKTPLDWFNLGSKYLRLHTNALEYQMIQNSDAVTFKVVTEPKTLKYRQIIEHFMVIGLRLVSEHIDSDYSWPLVCHLPLSKPDHHDKLQAIFKTEIKYNSNYMELEFDKRLLSHKMSGNVSFLSGMAEWYIKKQLKNEEKLNKDIKTSVRFACIALLGSGRCNLETVAISLGKGTKSLQRELQAENITFSEVLEDLRKETALAMLANKKIPIKQISGYLDYSSSKSFSLACKRWVGESPMAVRKEFSENNKHIDVCK
jgi:AraC-like DNA-binding protein